VKHGRTRMLVALAAVAGALVIGTSMATAQEAPAPPANDAVPLAGATVTPGWEQEVPTAPDLVGVKWDGDPNAQFAVEVQRGSDTWEQVSDVERNDVGPDAGTADAVGAANAAAATPDNASEPVWVGEDVSAVRVRLEDGTAADVTLQAVESTSALPTTNSALVAGRTAGWFVLVVAVVAIVLTNRRRAALLACGAVGLLALAGCVPAPPPSGPPVPLTSRDSWGADLPWSCDTGPDYAGSLTSAIVHHTVNTNDYPPENSASMLRAIWSYHVQTLGYCDIAYNFLIDKHGMVFEGRRGGIDRPVIAAHAAGHNIGSSGMAMLGTHTSVRPSDATIASLKNLMVWKFTVSNTDPNPDYAIVAHRQVTPTACPGDAADALMPGIRNDVRTWLNAARGGGGVG
jgi:hypothetical protein